MAVQLPLFRDFIRDYENGTPTIFLQKQPLFAVAYFRGPWLPMGYTNELGEYIFGMKSPLEILEDKEKKERLAKNLERLSRESQADLFGEIEREGEILNLFEGLLSLKEQDIPLYSRWDQKTKNKIRKISVPKKNLDVLLRKYVRPLIMKAPVSLRCHGGESEWSVKKSLYSHIPLGSVLSFDLANAFENVEMQYVFDFYYAFLKEKINQEDAKNLSGFLTTISTVLYKEYDHFALPQGSSISVPLFNRILNPIDRLFEEGCEKRNLRYSRWVDDFIISAPENNRNFGKMVGALAIVREDFPISLNKVVFQQNHGEYYLLGHKIIGGLIIPVKEDESKNRGKIVPYYSYATEREVEYEVDTFEGFGEGRLVCDEFGLTAVINIDPWEGNGSSLDNDFSTEEMF